MGNGQSTMHGHGHSYAHLVLIDVVGYVSKKGSVISRSIMGKSSQHYAR